MWENSFSDSVFLRSNWNHFDRRLKAKTIIILLGHLDIWMCR